MELLESETGSEEGESEENNNRILPPALLDCIELIHL